MGEHRVTLLKRISAPVPLVFSLLTNHSGLERFFTARFKHLKNGFPNKNGVGAIRRIKKGLFTVDEEITAFESNKLMRYRVIRGSPTQHYRGEIRFVDMGRERCEVHYHLQFRARVPGTGLLLAKSFEKKLHNALRQVAEKAESIWQN
jgi:uncharacterized protein YndB with AHSA1/START domain